MYRYGYEEKEAEAAYHLRQARIRFTEMFQDEAEAESVIAEVLGTGGVFARTYAQVYLMSSVIPHFEALQNLLVRRSLRRQYPEGWGKRRQEGEDTEEG